MISLSKQGWAKVAAVFSGVTLGIYWIPLREIESAGFDGLWAVTLFNLISLFLVLPFLIFRWRGFFPGRIKLHLGTLTAGLAFVCYAGAFLYTEVVRVIALFYLMPIWGFLLARLVVGEKISGSRWISMALGLGGLAIICGIEQGFPLPRNAGDWMALIGGILWSFASILMLLDQDDPENYTLGYIFWSTVISLGACLLGTYYSVLPAPQWSTAMEILPWFIPFCLIIVIPAAFATMYGPSQLNPGTVGLLFMTEISVGTATAAWLADEPFGLRELTGVILISLAGIVEPLYQHLGQKLGRGSTKNASSQR